MATETNDVVVSVTADSEASTGWNTQSSEAEAEHGRLQKADASGSQYMKTGDAYSSAKAGAMVNTDASCTCVTSDPCECKKDEENKVRATVLADSYAETGANGQSKKAEAEHGTLQSASDGGNQTMYTGNARSRVKAFAVVNTDVSH
ncbi:MAG TPA: hypothetical protein VMW41_05495 [Candidatus Bathyarchaeia archaeon]|nr:hypothetical protein [Candidatus Bathyarchaeia archaeon]